jgi:glycosyltransferase involved in cell wall biosynthesis
MNSRDISELKIFALIAFRDESKHLPGLLSHLRDYVDGFIGFDDCSTDNSFEIASTEPKMVGLFQRKIPSSDHYFEVQNREAMLRAACRFGANWVLCCDADERFETRFLEQLRGLCMHPPATVIGLRLVALWEDLCTYRVGNAFKYVLFPTEDPKPYYARGLLHQQWYPPRMDSEPKQVLDYNIYHLGSFTKEIRLERFSKFERIDPHHVHQRRGYNNLIDESDLRLAQITPERSFRLD